MSHRRCPLGELDAEAALMISSKCVWGSLTLCVQKFQCWHGRWSCGSRSRRQWVAQTGPCPSSEKPRWKCHPHSYQTYHVRCWVREMRSKGYGVSHLPEDEPSLCRPRFVSQSPRVPSLGQEDPLEKEMATHSSILAWRIPMDRGAWWAAVHRVAKFRHKQFSMHT